MSAVDTATAAPVDAAVEAVEDVTGKPDTPVVKAPKVDNSPLFKALVKEVKKAAGRGAEVVDKPSYAKVNVDGKTVAFVGNPTSKGVTVTVPRAVESGYDTVKVTATDEATVATDLVAALVAARKDAAKAK